MRILRVAVELPILLLGVALSLAAGLDGFVWVLSLVDIELPWYDPQLSYFVNKTWTFLNEHTQIPFPESWYTDVEGILACIIFGFVFIKFSEIFSSILGLFRRR